VAGDFLESVNLQTVVFTGPVREAGKADNMAPLVGK